jgi:cation diffusion facilitator CzcD-associated flavoprotein CzcO
MVKYAKTFENDLMKLFHIMVKSGKPYEMIRKSLTARMRLFLKDEKLIEGFTPKFSVGCRRIAPGDPCMVAVTKENVQCHFTGVKEITETGLIGDDGTVVETDTIVCATGFDVSYRPRFPLIGLGGTDLRKKWEVYPEGYFGLACPEIPNYITFIGPTWPVENGSVMGPLTSVVDYTLQIIKKMQTENIKYWVPRQDVTDEFNEHAQSWFKGTVWEEDCNAWCEFTL